MVAVDDETEFNIIKGEIYAVYNSVLKFVRYHYIRLVLTIAFSMFFFNLIYIKLELKLLEITYTFVINCSYIISLCIVQFCMNRESSYIANSDFYFLPLSFPCKFLSLNN